MLDFQIPDTSKAVGSIRRKIEQQYQSLHNLIHFNNGFFIQEKDSLKQKREAELAKLREQLDGEDSEYLIAKEAEIADRYQWDDEALLYIENNFYHAAFIMAYSCFESLVEAICLAKNMVPRYKVIKNINDLLKSHGITFSQEVNGRYAYVTGTLRVVRNYLTHNYNVKIPKDIMIKQYIRDEETKKRFDDYIKKYLDDLDVINHEAERKIGLSILTHKKIDRSVVNVVLSIQYVERAIKEIYFILSELAKILELNKPEEQKRKCENNVIEDNA